MRAILVHLVTAFLVFPVGFSGHAHAQKTQSKSASEKSYDEFGTPLMCAAAAGRLDEVRRLLKAGADVNEEIGGGLGITALMGAAASGHIEVVKVLIDAGADPNAAGGVAHAGFWSVLTVAMNRQNKNRMEMVDTLLAGGAKVNPPRWFPESPLDAAVNQRDIEMLKALLERGADVNWENEIGRTPLQGAISRAEPDLEVTRLLLEAGADPNKPRLWIGDDCESLLEAVDKRPKAPRDEVSEEIARLLRRHGAKKYSRKSHGQPCKS